MSSGFSPESNDPHPVPQPGVAPPAGQPPQYPYAPPYAAQSYQGGPQGHVKNEGDATGGLIPYKNPMALISYYCTVAALLPCIGFPIAIIALVLGILGLRAVKKNPVISGTVHAWIGVVGGALIALGYIVGIVIFVVMANMA
jgi:hypothetical protein